MPSNARHPDAHFGTDLTAMATAAVPPAALDALEQLATLHGRSRAAEIRAALRAHLERYGLGESLPARLDRAKMQPRTGRTSSTNQDS